MSDTVNTGRRPGPLPSVLVWGLVCWALIGVYAAAGVGWLIGGGSGWPASETVGRFLRHPRSANGLDAAVDPVWAFRGFLAAFIVWVLLSVAVTVRIGRNRSHRNRGLAARSDARPFAADAIRAKASFLRPTSGADSIGDVGVHLGTSTWGEVWASIEESFVMIAPPRSGKTARFVAPTVVRWPGPAIVTGLRRDILDWTTPRRETGNRWVFSPTVSHAEHPDRTLTWSPLTGCADELTAKSRAIALLSGRGRAVGNEEYWREEGSKVLTAYLIAGAVGGFRPSDLLQWASNSKAPTPVQVLREHGFELWAAQLEAAANEDERYKAGVWGQVNQALHPWMFTAVRATCDLPAGRGFDPPAFVRSTDTLYVLGNPREQQALAGLCIALVDACTEAARHWAFENNGRLDPPLLCGLDEVANVAPLHQLDELLSTGGGTGICTAAILQSVGQAREKFGDAMGQAIVRDLATIRVVLGGGGDARDLRELSDLLGERDETVHSYNHGSVGQATSVSSSNRLRPVMTPAEIRMLKPGRALVIPRANRPVLTEMPSVFDGDPRKVLR